MKSTILKIVIFSIAFAFVEASVVMYLRLLLLPGIAFLQPQAALKIIQNSALLTTEMIREAGTLIMLGAVAFLAAKGIKRILAFFFLAFGIWDIFYYIFLKLIIGWPVSFTDTDIFFLLPVPWVGPVFVPIIISSALVLGSILYLRNIKS